MATPSTREPADETEPGAGEETPRPRTAARRALQLFLFAAGILLVFFLFRAVGWPAIAGNLERVGASRFFLLVALYTLTQVAFALGWWLVVDPRLPASRLARLFGVYLAGDTFNYIAPGGVAGEPVKTRLLGRSTSMGSALASITLHKHADLVAQWAFVSIGVVYAVWRFPMPLAARVAAIAGAAGLGGLLLLLTWAMRRGTYGPVLRRLARWKPLGQRLDRFHASAEAVDERIRGFTSDRRGRYLASVGWCFLGWCGGWLETYLILRFLSAAAGWGTALAIEALAMALNNMLLFIPGRVGSAEGVRAGVFVLLGLPAAQGVAYGLVRRGRELAWTLPGFFVLIKEHAFGLAGKKARELPRLAREEWRP